VCRTWCRLSVDEYLWRDLVYCHWGISRSIGRSPCSSTWREEYERLSDRCPVVESEVLCSHVDQVLHVSFSHDAQLFATTSKDGFIKVYYSVNLQFLLLHNYLFSFLCRCPTGE